MSLMMNVHPWFLSDAIRWYVEHPADRSTLGTLGAQARLIAALSSAPPPTLA